MIDFAVKFTLKCVEISMETLLEVVKLVVTLNSKFE